ncbi:MAG: alpha-2-macroglobulin family protein, partial [Kiritimatiellia bacterium]
QNRSRGAEGIRSLNGAVLQEKLDRAFIMPERRPGLKFAHPGWILNAKGAARVEVLTENEGALDLRLQRVHANNLVAFAVRASGEDGWRSQENPERTLSETLLEKRIGDVDNGVFPLDLSDTLRSSGQGVYRIELTGRNSGRRIEKLIALSDVGLLARRNGGELMVWALELGSARPVPDLEIEVWSDTRQRLAQGRTDSEGLCVLTPEKGNALLILGRSHKSLGLLILKGDQPFPDLNGSRPFLSDGNEAFLYTGRGMYRPEETVQFRGIVRGKDFALPGRFPVELRMHDAAGLTVWRERRELSEWGTVEASVALQPEWPNGTYRITLSLPGDDAPLWGETSFHLESFAPPQVVVKAFTPQGEEAVPDLFTVEVDAQMLYGAPAATHSGKSTLTLIPETFRSSEYPDHQFSDSRKAGFGSWSRPLRDFVTNEQGQAQVQVRIPGDKTAPSALRAVVGISVTEFSGREASCFVSRRVDTVPYYLGLRIQSPQPGGHAEVNVVGVLPGGEKMQADVELDAAWYRVNTQQGIRRNANGRYTWFSEEVDVLEGESKIRMEAGECSFQVPLLAEGRYRIAVRDPGTGFSCSQTVSVGDWAQAPERADRIGMRLDRDKYEPGTEATLTLNTPFSGRLLLTLESERVQMRQTLWVDAPQKTIKLQVPETDAAHLWIRATLIRPQPDSGQAPVLRSEGALPLWIHREDLHAPLELEVAEQLRPSTQVELLLRGEPGAEVVVSGVDDGILQLSDFQTPDPLSWFLMLRRAVSLSWDSYDDLMPELGSGLFVGDAEMGGGMAAAIGKRLNPVDAKRFRPLSWWSGAQRIPESGVLRLKMSMPEFSGRVRWMAVQVAGRGMGHAEAFSKVGREVIVQQSAPLFMAPGDRSVWSVRLHNRGDSVRTVVLKPTVRGPVELRESGEILQLGAGESLQRNFSIHAAEKIGKAELVMGVQVEDEFWQDLIELAVRPGEAFEERTLRRVLAPGQVINIDAGGEMLAGTGSRTLNLQSMPVLQLESARSYLMRYPYGCLEQTVSAAAPALYLGEWTEDAGAGADQILRAGVQELWKKQKRDGSFGYWHAGDQSSVAGSLGALMFLQEAESKGVEVDERSLRAGLNWARGWLIRQQWDSEASDKNLQITRACKVLAMAGELDTGWMQRLRERKEDLGGYARIVAAESLMLGGRRALGLELLEGLNRVDRGWGWQSSRAGNAELLWILLRLDPEDGRIPELLKSLLADRNPEGHWGQTFENAQVIRALVEYAKVWPS